MEMAPQVPSTQPGGWSLQSHDGSSSSCLEGMGGQTFWADSEGVPPYVPPLPAQLTHTALGLKFSTSFGMFASKIEFPTWDKHFQLCSL